MNTESSSIADTLNYALFVKTFTGGQGAISSSQVPVSVPVSVPIIQGTGTSTSSTLSPAASQSYSATSSVDPVSTQSVTGSTVSVKSSSNKILKYTFYALLIFLAYSYFTSISFKKTRISRSINKLSASLKSSNQSVSEKAKVNIAKAKVNIANSKDSKSIESAEYQQIINKYLKNYQ